MSGISLSALLDDSWRMPVSNVTNARDRKIYVVKAVNKNGRPIDGIWESLKQGKARIGWSYNDDLDLRQLAEKRRRGEAFGEREGDAWKCHRFLTAVRPGDYLVYPHQPKRRHFSVVQIDDDGDYNYEPPSLGINGDFRSTRACTLITAAPLHWSDAIVPPIVKHRLGLQGRFYELKVRDSFFSMLEQLDQAGRLESESSEYRMARIAEAIQRSLPDLLHKQFPRHDLSRRLAADLFEAMGYAVEVQEGPYEKGSDLIVMVGSDLLPEGSERRVGVQVFSFDKTVSVGSIKQKLDQLLEGWSDNQLDSGALLTTGTVGEDPQGLIDEHNVADPKRQVIVIDGTRLSEMFLGHFGGELASYLRSVSSQ